jgi:uncharacterized protein
MDGATNPVKGRSMDERNGERDWLEGVPGTKERFVMRVGEMPNGAPYYLPVLAVIGDREGPTLFLNAAMHGDEPLGTAIVRDIWRSLEPTALRGRLVAIPMANYAGVATRTRTNVVEMYPGPYDMNRIFPGNAKGTMTERIADLIMRRFVDEADFVFDIHSASVGAEWEPYTAVPAVDVASTDSVDSRARELGVSFGTRIVLEGMGIKGSLADAARAREKVAGMVELGVANRSTPAEREAGCQGVRNLLVHTGMSDGQVLRPRRQAMLREMERMRADRGGFLHLYVEVGEDVEANQPLGVVVDMDGATLQQFAAPYDGIVCRLSTMGVVGTGDFVAYVGRS